MESLGDAAKNYEVKQEPSIKLTKNSKGYNWEIRIMSHDIEELQRLNDLMIKKWGDKK
ncbi:hypothetical protein LCGC14_1644080 [marine sediment metagenome]|uniref:Uncharacterized protein n=1 Tax=marine sediment metagenome TaxID=412755 RepID=A0A0F9ILC0_9ZZZZ